MSIGNFIQDGSGTGYLAKVSDEQRLQTDAVTESSLQHAGLSAESFNVNTNFVSITVGTETPLFYFKNEEPVDVVLSAWFIGIGIAGGTPTENILMRVYPNPTSVSGGVAVTVQNRQVGAGRSFTFTARKQDAGTPLTATLPATPLLFQTQTPQSRVFGEVDLILPRNQSVIVTVQANGAQTMNIYTGFAGFLSSL